MTSSSQIDVVSWNVFEDGLTDQPGSIGLPSEFERRFSALLEVLAIGSDGSTFVGFSKARDLTRLPPVVPVNSTAAFLGCIDTVYVALYHCIGGEAQFRSGPDVGDSKNLGNSLRTLFLHTSLAYPGGAKDDNAWTQSTLEVKDGGLGYPKDISTAGQTPSESNLWYATHFESEVEKVCMKIRDLQDRQALKARLQEVHKSVFDPVNGVLTWDYKTLDGLWKREKNIRQKLQGELKTFFFPQLDLTAEQKAALSLFCRTRSSSDDWKLGEPLHAFAEASFTSDGELMEIRTKTFQSTMKHLLECICQHSLDRSDAADAFIAYAGVAPVTARARAELLLTPLMKFVDEWVNKASLPIRQTLVRGVLENHTPSIITLVEYDEEWRQQPLPASRPYIAKNGKAQASVVYDSAEFDCVNEAFSLGYKVRSDHERGGGTSEVSPKSSCLCLLERKADKILVFVAAVHLDSDPPSVTKKVLCRHEQMRAVLSEIGSFTKMSALAGRTCIFMICGDFNALREEFVYGNSDDFYAAAAVLAVQPTLPRPPVNAPRAAAPDPPIAYIATDGTIRFTCAALDGGELREASKVGPNESDGLVCTRSGSSMVIDFIVIGSVGGCDVKVIPRAVVTHDESLLAADPLHGVTHSVLKWGSDHLPVGCRVLI